MPGRYDRTPGLIAALNRECWRCGHDIEDGNASLQPAGNSRPATRRMKILQICPYDLDRHGGVQRHIVSLSSALVSRGHESLILAPGDSEEVRPGVYRIGRMRSVSFAGTRFEVTWAGAAELRDLLEVFRNWQPDAAHFHTPWAPIMPFQVLRRLRLPRIATFHDTPPPGFTGFALRTLFKLLSRRLLAQLDAAIAVSTAPLGHLRPGKSGVRPIIVPPVTDLAPLFALEKKPTPEPRILFVGRLEPRKGIKVLLEAANQLAAGHVPLPPGVTPPRFIVAGDGDLQAEVLMAEKKLGRRWLQHVPSPTPAELGRLLSEAAIAVSPAIYGESFGIVITEALASGTPIVSAGNAGYRTVLDGPGRSLLVPAGDPPALARRIAALLSNPAEIQSLSSWGRHYARRFDVADRIAEFEDIYRGAIRHYAASKLEG